MAENKTIQPTAEELEKYADKQILHFRTREETDAFLCRLNR